MTAPVTSRTPGPVAAGAEALQDLLASLGVDGAGQAQDGRPIAEMLAAAVLDAAVPALSPEERQRITAIRRRMKARTQGPWSRPLNTRWKNVVTAVMPKGDPASRLHDNTDANGQPERTTIVAAPTWSMGGFLRKQSGKDLDFIAHSPEDIDFLLEALEGRTVRK